MALGANVVPKVLEAIKGDMDNTVFSFIPNTAEVSWFGMIKELENKQNEEKLRIIRENDLNDAEMLSLMNKRCRVEKVAIKDAKLRTFITQDVDRDDMVAHVYDITYGTIKAGTDTLVVIDDSIVRGTTLKQSILRMLDRLGPKKIIVVSSAPQIRYPDCYGIDMAKMGDLIAFQAAVSLLKERGMAQILEEVNTLCESDALLPKDQVKNRVKMIYDSFTSEEISAKIGQLLRPSDIQAEVQVIYQSLSGLHSACPKNKGDWYFSGDYPTPGGNKVANKAYMNYFKGVNERAY